MLVTRVETVRSPCRSFCWILVHTDNGLVGLGELCHAKGLRVNGLFLIL